MATCAFWSMLNNPQFALKTEKRTCTHADTTYITHFRTAHTYTGIHMHTIYSNTCTHCHTRAFTHWAGSQEFHIWGNQSGNVQVTFHVQGQPDCCPLSRKVSKNMWATTSNPSRPSWFCVCLCVAREVFHVMLGHTHAVMLHFPSVCSPFVLPRV